MVDFIDTQPNFLGGAVVIEIVQEPQSNVEEKVNPIILKYDFFSGTDPFIFISTGQCY